MIKRLLCVFCGVLMFGTIWAQDLEQEDLRPQRTPEEEALKQTTRLVRELSISDSIRIDTIYRMHLKYARFRQKGLTRAENMNRLQAIHDELKELLTPEEFELFMNQPAETPHLRRPRYKDGLIPAKQQQPAEPQSEDLP